MKSAYELAMERLDAENGPAVQLTDEQRVELDEINRKAQARIAEAKILKGEAIAAARAQGNGSELAQLEQDLATDIQRIEADSEAAREKVRCSGKSS